MSDDEVLMMLEMAARAEREAGFDGWSEPPPGFMEAAERLVREGFALKKDGKWFMPTKEGGERVAHRIHKVQ